MYELNDFWFSYFSRPVFAVPEGWKLVENKEHKIERLETELKVYEENREEYKSLIVTYEKWMAKIEKQLEELRK